MTKGGGRIKTYSCDTMLRLEKKSELYDILREAQRAIYT